MPIQDLNGQVRAIRANLALINPVWDLHGLPVLNQQYHALINLVWDLYVFARMISATTSPYKSCTGSVWVCLNLKQGGSPKRKETHRRRRLAPRLDSAPHCRFLNEVRPRNQSNWLQLWITTDTGSVFIHAYISKYAIVLINNWWHWSNVIAALSHLSFGGIKKHALNWGPIWLFRWAIMGERDWLLCMLSVLILLMCNHWTNKQFC